MAELLDDGLKSHDLGLQPYLCHCCGEVDLSSLNEGNELYDINSSGFSLLEIIILLKSNPNLKRRRRVKKLGKIEYTCVTLI